MAVMSKEDQNTLLKMYYYWTQSCLFSYKYIHVSNSST